MYSTRTYVGITNGIASAPRPISLERNLQLPTQSRSRFFT